MQRLSYHLLYPYLYEVCLVKPIGDRLANSRSSYDLFYLGGSTSLRGWTAQRYLTSKSDGVVRPVGGLIKVLFNSELRIPIGGIFGVDLFVDGGILAVSLSELANQVDAWKEGAGWNYGAELTVSTPLGPIRLYYAIPFTEPGKSVINLGVPYAF